MAQDIPKLIVILGPTSSGKTKLAVELAQEFDGEIVSADSRQVYRGMDVCTGKDLAEYGSVKHHLIDVADPMDEFSLAQYKKMAEAAIKDIAARGKVPFLVGGSGLYLQAVVDNFELTLRGPDQALRGQLEELTVDALYERLSQLNPKFASNLNDSDRKNKRRLIRYVELNSGDAPQAAAGKGVQQHESLVLGLDPGKEIIDERIRQRLIDRLENEDMVMEIDQLHAKGVTWQRMKDFGLENRFISEYLQEKTDYDTMVERLNIAIRQFAKRQMTWFRRWEKQGQKISWLDEGRKIEEARGLIEEFLASNE